MIDSVAGILMRKDPTHAIIDVGGVRLKVAISVNTYERLPSTMGKVELLTYLHVREDILDLYGFDHQDQRELFLLLINISGIGPRSAMTILSGASTSEFKRRIIAGDVKSLTVIPGIGTKTARRIIIELKEKFVKDTDDDLIALTGGESMRDEIRDALDALVSLGYSRAQAQQAIRKLERSGDLTGSLEEIIKRALAKM
ncbi:MAG: Holliday junction branch migration protein RuvA [FCB group bacterium]|nr:Holliday junction branch migration protein RuvA [FCB group bacterium]